MKICLITAFPPSRRQLNEYGLHLARELKKNPLISLSIIGDELSACDWATDAHGHRLDPTQELPDFDVLRCWRFNSIVNPYRVLKAVREIKPDVVWYNLVFSTFATQQYPVAAFAGLCIPAMSRALGFYTHVTLHHLMEHVDFGAARIRAERLYRVASSVATRMLLFANSTSVLLPSYRRTLIEKYRASNVHFRSHGILGARPEPPDFSRRGNPHQRILAIGHWGTYKRLEALLAAFPEVLRRVPDARLMIAGANHHTTPGYWESLAEKHRGDPHIEFRGYIAEEDIPDLYAGASVVVLPYDSSTGSSGPAHQACQYGVPIVSSDLPEFLDMATDEGMAVEFYHRGNTAELTEKLMGVLSSPELQHNMAEQNFSAAMRMTMPQIIREYLRSFDLQKKTRALAAHSRFRRPRWTGSRTGTFSYSDWSPWS